MSDMTPEVSAEDFIRILKEGKIEELKSCEVVLPGETPTYLFTAIIGHADVDSKTFARTQADYLAVKTNIVGGKDVQEILAKSPNLDNLAKGRAVLAEKRARERANAAV